MDMVVVLGAIMSGLAAAFLAQIVAHFLPLFGHKEKVLVGGTFFIACLASAPFIAKLVGV